MNELLLLLVPLCPLLMAPIVLLLGVRRPRSCGWMATAAVAVSLLSLALIGGREPSLTVTWMEFPGLQIEIGLEIDALSRYMAWIVSGVGLLVTIYSVEFIKERRPAFFALSSFFMASMLTLVFANSFLLLFAAWEAVGVASFCLIGFHFEEEQARQAARKAFLLTRLGDLGFLLGWLAALLLVGTTRIEALLREVESQPDTSFSFTLLALLFLAGAIGKSAQFPLSSWLPDAMAGPTPVSALIHSATMVAAGIYLLLRLFPLFSRAPGALDVILWIGAITALSAALLATMQMDLKRVLAWSTISQLGEMMIAIGLGGALAASFHLATHAVFKSSLFLAAGGISHCVGSRRLDRLGRLTKNLPITTLVFGVAALSLAGVPPFSGFWSEEHILSEAAEYGIWPAICLIVLIFLAGIYIGRAAGAITLRWSGSTDSSACHDPVKAMTCSMLGLAAAAATLGFFLSFYLEELLPFRSGPELSWAWRGAAIAGSFGGLGLGLWRVQRVGPKPAFGSFPRFIEIVLKGFTSVPARLLWWTSRRLQLLESALDASALALARATLVVSGVASSTRSGLETSDLQGVEPMLDEAAAGGAEFTLWIAEKTAFFEEQGLSEQLDRFAESLARAGDHLRELQSGRVYLYTLGLFIWVILAACVAAVLTVF